MGDAQGEPVVWFKDTFTGRTMNRPGMDKLMMALQSGKLSRIVVWRLDRLGRTTKGLCILLDEPFDIDKMITDSSAAT
jgi:DNA invertase Pin-like site-specific DNA recombinase